MQQPPPSGLTSYRHRAKAQPERIRARREVRKSHGCARHAPAGCPFKTSQGLSWREAGFARTKRTVERSGDATASGGSNLTNCSKSGATLSPYRIDTTDFLRIPNRAHLELVARPPAFGVRGSHLVFRHSAFAPSRQEEPQTAKSAVCSTLARDEVILEYSYFLAEILCNALDRWSEIRSTGTGMSQSRQITATWTGSPCGPSGQTF